MYFARKPFVRSTTLLAACAASFILLSSGTAQQRDSRLELAAVGQQPPAPTLNPRHPDTYVVRQGDTLWDISKRFLNNPYLWPQIWEENKYITDAHWIYPGDPLTPGWAAEKGAKRLRREYTTVA